MLIGSNMNCTDGGCERNIRTMDISCALPSLADGVDAISRF